MDKSLLRQISASIKNIFTTGNFIKRYNNSKIQASTIYGRVVEKAESFPYGFKAKAMSGKVFVFCQSGNFDGFEISPVIADGGPDLKDGDAALYTESGGWIICRDNGAVELYGKNYGGLIKVEELKTQLAKNNQILQILLTIIRGAPVPEPGLGSPSALQAALAIALSTTAVGDFSQIESDKVFHGNGSN